MSPANRPLGLGEDPVVTGDVGEVVQHVQRLQQGGGHLLVGTREHRQQPPLAGVVVGQLGDVELLPGEVLLVVGQQRAQEAGLVHRLDEGEIAEVLELKPSHAILL